MDATGLVRPFNLELRCGQPPIARFLMVAFFPRWVRDHHAVVQTVSSTASGLKVCVELREPGLTDPVDYVPVVVFSRTTSSQQQLLSV
jgi:hypothetical protein